ncbi:MAG: anaerobic sulfatase maturase [Firmicutes bacterium]|nr:anaerobic sulfatase maturase [Bacillota bacterium]
MSSPNSTQGAPFSFHVMAKPTGSRCNLHCDYCFFLEKEKLYPGSSFRMPDEVHEAYISQLFQSQRGPEVTVAWQGGEPTLMGIDFFRRSVELQKKYAKLNSRVENTFQTNGILLDDEWCRFFRENNFLVGLSLDGPGKYHNKYRKDKSGKGTFDKVFRALQLLRRHKVEFNILCAVSRANVDHPLEVYRFFRDEAGVEYVQFIPIVERAGEKDRQKGNVVTERTVKPEAWGKFLKAVFDEWVGKDVGKMFVPNFDGILAGWLGMAGTICIFGPQCGLSMVMEHNGDVYSCDHFVEPDYCLGNILQTSMTELIITQKQKKFRKDKWDTLPGFCRKCDYLFVCNGECPKNRFVDSPDGEPGMNWLCGGYKAFYEHAEPEMKIMAGLLRQGRPADEIMKLCKPEKKSGKSIR